MTQQEPIVLAYDGSEEARPRDFCCRQDRR
jgi:hypothetical protein